MWETLFDPSMLGGPKEVAIWCPEESDALLLCELLADHGAIWNGGESLRNNPYYSYGGEMAYYVQPDLRVLRGDRGCVRHEKWRYICCKFDGSLCNVSIPEVEDLI